MRWLRCHIVAQIILIFDGAINSVLVKCAGSAVFSDWVTIEPYDPNSISPQQCVSCLEKGPGQFLDVP